MMGQVPGFDVSKWHETEPPMHAVGEFRNGDIDGNADTINDPAWVPLIDTPMHPEYPCAHFITAAAVATVLESEFGSGPIGQIAMTSPTAPGVTRTWHSIEDYVTDVKNARIWSGVHYRFSTEVGAAMGRKIGDLACQDYMIVAAQQRPSGGPGARTKQIMI
jgi:vanadium-dependent haloperoxidase-like protein